MDKKSITINNEFSEAKIEFINFNDEEDAIITSAIVLPPDEF